jgi:hypothetical protein
MPEHHEIASVFVSAELSAKETLGSDAGGNLIVCSHGALSQQSGEGLRVVN